MWDDSGRIPELGKSKIYLRYPLLLRIIQTQVHSLSTGSKVLLRHLARFAMFRTWRKRRRGELGMSVMEDVLEAIGTAVEQITEAQTSIAGAVSEVETALNQAEAFGMALAIEGMSQAKEQLEAAVEQIAATATSVEQAQVTAQTVADST